jgi:HD-like signal output (HDOD) protein
MFPAAPLNEQRLVDVVTQRIQRGDLKLPPAPRIAMKIRQLFGSGAEIETIAKLIKQDVSISGKLISISNSVAYGGMTKNTDVTQAVSRLGIDRTVEVVMSICCRGYFITSHPVYHQRLEDLWWHSQACAQTIEIIIENDNLSVDRDLFSLALLHDVGKLVLIQAACHLQKPKKHQEDIDFETLQDIMRDHHEHIGGLLLEKWGFDKTFTSLIRLSRLKKDGSSPMAMQVLHRAGLLATIAGFDDGTENPAEASNALETMGYSADVQADLTTKIASRIEQLRYLFG